MERPVFQHIPHIGSTRLPLYQRDNYSGIKRIEINGKRWYGIAQDGSDAVPSVTTILENKKNPVLERWKKRVGEEEANRISQLAKDKGQDYHSLIEAYLNNERYIPAGTSLMAVDMFRQVQPILNRIDNIQMLEQQMWCPTHAGTPDCIASFDGDAAIIDFKTSKQELYPESLLKYRLQCYAYHKLWEYRYRDWFYWEV